MALTPEQEKALDQLVAQMRQAQPKRAPAPQPDMLQTWLGISQTDLREKIFALLGQKDEYEKHFLDWVNTNPLDANVEFLGLAAWAFYQAEKGVNPKIETYLDAFYYISTCASVGFADMFAATQAGRTIAAIVMMVGPSLTGRALNYPNSR
ncbi:MAG TPA: potassium channel family protein [Anaerolineales bacterium]|nr:potassium channel family protein [Anaerolineales bacterium]